MLLLDLCKLRQEEIRAGASSGHDQGVHTASWLRPELDFSPRRPARRPSSLISTCTSLFIGKGSIEAILVGNYHLMTNLLCTDGVKHRATNIATIWFLTVSDFVLTPNFDIFCEVEMQGSRYSTERAAGGSSVDLGACSM